jgi:hypothetical protein
MVNDEEHHFPRRDLAKNGVREPDAVEVAIAPAFERRQESQVHPLPTSQELSLTGRGLFRREILSWGHEPAASSASACESVAVIIPQLGKRPGGSAG